MSRYVKIAAIAAAGFYRLGRHWPQAGTTIDIELLSDAEVERLASEPNLRVTPADGPVDVVGDDELRTQLKGVIAALETDSFQKDGKPKLEALRSALPELKDRITAAVRDDVWAEIALAS